MREEVLISIREGAYPGVLAAYLRDSSLDRKHVLGRLHDMTLAKDPAPGHLNFIAKT